MTHRPLLLLAGLLAAIPAAGAPAAGVCAPGDTLRVEVGLVDAGAVALPQAGGALVDLGTLAATPARSGRLGDIAVRRRVSVRVVSCTGATGFARLRAEVAEAGAGAAVVRVDGVPLGPAPALVDAAAPLGLPVSHRLEIEVPRSAPAGPLASEITWTAETE